MNSILARVAWCAAICTATPIPLLAKPVLHPEGSVMVDRGNGFERVTDTVQIQPGDFVVVNEGSAKVTCDSGWTGRLEAGRMYRIERTICEDVGQQGDLSHGGNSGAEAGTNAASQAAGTVGGGAVGSAGGISTVALVVGGVAIAVGVGGALIAGSSKSKSGSASP